MDLRERFIETNGINLHVMEAGPADGPMLLFLHGFPEFWYAWRKQLSYFAKKVIWLLPQTSGDITLATNHRRLPPIKLMNWPKILSA